MANIGTDQWASEADDRRMQPTGPFEPLHRLVGGISPRWALAIFVAIAALYPFLVSTDFLVRVGVNVLLLAMLAVGLNVVVGWAGLLDLGFVAFYGMGAYGYAFLSSNQFDLHFPTPVTLVIVTVAVAVLGLLLGLPSGRLVGDYLAIMTLFFAQVFVELATNLDRLTLPWSDTPLDVTGGPNGIAGLDPFNLFGFEFTRIDHYFYLLLALLVLAVIGFNNLNNSRTGRAWRSLREDTLASQHMTMPVKRLKLMAYMFGAATAGLAGSVFAAVQVGVFPQNFEVTLLIMIYAALILGGSGSIAGAVVGAIVIAAVPEALRSPVSARWLFYGALLVALVVKLRPWQRVAGVLGGVVALGLIIRGIVNSIWGDAVGVDTAGGVLTDLISNWVVILTTNQEAIGNYAFVLLLVAVLVVSRLKGWVQAVALVPTIYLAAFVWENRLVLNPSITRQLLFGAILVVMMTARPHGLLGKPRVEIA